MLNTGENASSIGGEIQTSTSVYSAIGQALPSPAQEPIEEVQAFNVFNHPSFDTPNNNVEFYPFFADPADYTGTGPTSCSTQQTGIGTQSAYACPPNGQLRRIQHTVGSPRFLQVDLHLTF